jgi:ribosomal protein S27AE
MPETLKKTVKKIFSDYPEIKFTPDAYFSYDYEQSSIHYSLTEKYSAQLLLHEIAHYKLGHRRYNRDIQLVEQEVSAWQYAKELLSKKYKITIYKKLVASCIATYQDWLAQRSSCPRCNTIGIQDTADRYYCPSCGIAWKVNIAKTCALRRKIDS